MKVVCIIQVRAGSTRLPNKAFLPLAGKSMTRNIIERTQRATKLNEIVLAFPHTGTDADTTFADLAVRCGVGYYCGTGIEENDLVGRYLAAAKCYYADIIVRIPGDNPCVEPEYIDRAVCRYFDEARVFVTNTTTPVFWNGGLIPVDGIGAEVLSYSRLQWLDWRTRGASAYREHPHQWFFENGRAFLPSTDIRLDINTQSDYDFISKIYSHFGHNRFTVEEVLGFLDAKTQLAS